MQIQLRRWQDRLSGGITVHLYLYRWPKECGEASVRAACFCQKRRVSMGPLVVYLQDYIIVVPKWSGER